jgi:hypothetical protein
VTEVGEPDRTESPPAWSTKIMRPFIGQLLFDNLTNFKNPRKTPEKPPKHPRLKKGDRRLKKKRAKKTLFDRRSPIKKVKKDRKTRSSRSPISD